jgi:hypothetical protein
LYSLEEEIVSPTTGRRSVSKTPHDTVQVAQETKAVSKVLSKEDIRKEKERKILLKIKQIEGELNSQTIEELNHSFQDMGIPRENLRVKPDYITRYIEYLALEPPDSPLDMPSPINEDFLSPESPIIRT